MTTERNFYDFLENNKDIITKSYKDDDMKNLKILYLESKINYLLQIENLYKETIATIGFHMPDIKYNEEFYKKKNDYIEQVYTQTLKKITGIINNIKLELGKVNKQKEIYINFEEYVCIE